MWAYQFENDELPVISNLLHSIRTYGPCMQKQCCVQSHYCVWGVHSSSPPPPEVPLPHLKPLCQARFWPQVLFSCWRHLKRALKARDILNITLHLSPIWQFIYTQDNQCTISRMLLQENWMVIKYCWSTTAIFKIWYLLYTVKLSVCSDFNALHSVSQVIHSCYSLLTQNHRPFLSSAPKLMQDLSTGVQLLHYLAVN